MKLLAPMPKQKKKLPQKRLQTAYLLAVQGCIRLTHFHSRVEDQHGLATGEHNDNLHGADTEGSYKDQVKIKMSF